MNCNQSNLVKSDLQMHLCDVKEYVIPSSIKQPIGPILQKSSIPKKKKNAIQKKTNDKIGEVELE